jgi:hypothetical protein
MQLPEHLPRPLKRPPVLPPDAGAVEISRYITPTGLQLDPDVGYREWYSIGRTILFLHEWTPWAIGDWLNFGEDRFPMRYHQAAEITGRSIKTMMNLAYIARAIPPDERREELPIAYHDAVCSIKEPEKRKELLQKGIDEDNRTGGHLTVPRFREIVREAKDEHYAIGNGRVIEEAQTEICNYCGSEIPKPRGT